MNDDVRKYIYGALMVFVAGVLIWVGFIYVNACGFTLSCQKGIPSVSRTPIPTLLPATQPVMETGSGKIAVSDHEACHVAASDLIGVWVSANSPEQGAFQFTDINGRNCEATFADVEPLFKEPNLWHPDSLSCVSCHSVDVTISPAQLDLSSYAGIMAGSRREDVESKGTDILGGGNWKSSLLHEFLSTIKADIPGHNVAGSDATFVFAGKPLPENAPTVTPVSTEGPTATATP